MDIGRLFEDAWELIRSGKERLLAGALVLTVIWYVPFLALVPALVTAWASVRVGYTPNAAVGRLGGTLLVGSIILCVVGLIAVALVYPALEAGLYSGVIQRVRGSRQMEYADVFKGFKYWVDAFLASLLEGLAYFGIVLAGILLLLLVWLPVRGFLGIPVAVLATIAVVGAVAAAWIYLAVRWIYLLPAIVDRKATALQSFAMSGELVQKAGWWITLAAAAILYLIVSMAGGIGSSAGNVSSNAAFVVFVLLVSFLVSTAATAFRVVYIVAMYIQASGETNLFDANVRGVRSPASPAAYGAPVAGGWARQAPATWPQSPPPPSVSGSPPQAAAITSSAAPPAAPPAKNLAPPPGTLMPLGDLPVAPPASAPPAAADEKLS